MSTGRTMLRPLATAHCWSASPKSAALVLFPSTANGVNTPSPNHLTISLAQLRTNDDGHTIIHFCMVFLPRGLCRKSVHINVRH